MTTGPRHTLAAVHVATVAIDCFPNMLKFYGDGAYGHHFLHKLQAGCFVGQTMQNNCVRRAVISIKCCYCSMTKRKKFVV